MAAKPKEKLLPRAPVLGLMAAGFVVGFALYLALAPAQGQPRASIADVRFSHWEGLVWLQVLNEEKFPVRCEVSVTILPLGGSPDSAAGQTSVIGPLSREEVAVPAPIPDTPFDYEIGLDCSPEEENPIWYRRPLRR